MASKSLGTLTVDLIAKIGGFKAGMTEAERASEKAANKILANKQRMASKLDKIYGGMKSGALVAFAAIGAGAAAAGAVLAKAFQEGVDYADKFDEISARLQVDVEKLQELNFAAGLSGVDLSVLESALPKLSKAMQESTEEGNKFQKLFASLGVSAIDPLTGKLKDATDFFKEFADVFASVDEPAAEAALAMEVFGRSGATMLELLNRGSEGIDELGQKARDMGLILDETTTSSIANMRDNVDILKTSFTVLGAKIAGEVAPQIVDLTNKFIEWNKDGKAAKDIVDALKTAFEVLTVAVGGLQIAMGALQAIIGTVIAVVGGLVKQVGIAIENVYKFGKALLSLDFKGAIQSQIDGAKKSFDNFTSTLGYVGASVSDASETIVSGANKIGGAVSGNTTAASASLKQLGKDAQDTGKIVGNIADRLNGKTLTGILSTFEDKPEGTPKPKKTGGGGGGGGSRIPKITEEQKELERLQQQYQSLNASLDERLWMIGKEGELAKVTYETLHGDLQRLSEAEKQVLLTKAEKYDLDVKAYKLAEEQAKTMERDTEHALQVIENLDHQLLLLGKTADEQERLNMLRDLGTNIDAKYIETAQAKLAQLQETEKVVHAQEQLLEGFKNSFASAFEAVIDGSMSAKDAFKSMIDDMLKQIMRMIINQWTEKLFAGLQGMGGGAGGGGFWSSLFSGMAGGKASGGNVNPFGMHRVNEYGPEMLSIKGKDYLMMGSDPGKITPHGRFGGGMSQNNNFIIQGKIDRRTEMQIAQRVGQKSAQAQNRNH